MGLQGGSERKGGLRLADIDREAVPRDGALLGEPAKAKSFSIIGKGF